MVLIQVDTFTIFDTMESMKGHKNQGEQFKENWQKHTFSYRFCLFVCFDIALGGTYRKTTDPQSRIRGVCIPDLGPLVDKRSSLGNFSSPPSLICLTFFFSWFEFICLVFHSPVVIPTRSLTSSTALFSVICTFLPPRSLKPLPHFIHHHHLHFSVTHNSFILGCF